MSKDRPSMPQLRLVRPGSGRRKVIAFVVLFVLVTWIINDPAGAANFFADVLTGLAALLRGNG